MRVPTKLPAHRVACLALYRAFLSHIPHLPLEPAQTKFAEWHIRSEFKRNQNAQGIRPVRKALSYARRSETLVRAATTGDLESITKLSEEITQLQKRREEDLFVATLSPPPPKPPPPPAVMLKCKRKLRLLDPNYQPPRRSLVPRLPQLIESNMFPILRWPGQKTPLHISITIKRKTVKKQKRFDLLELLEVWTVLAQEEDIFDDIIARETGVREEGGTWEHGVKSTSRDVKDLIRKDELRGVEMTKRFMEIIEQQRVIRDDMILGRDRRGRRKGVEGYQLGGAGRGKRDGEEAELLAGGEAALEGLGKTVAGEWGEDSDAPFAHCSSHEESEHGDLEQEHDDPDQEYEEHEYQDPEHGDPEHEYEEPEYEESEYEDPEYFSDSPDSDLDNASPGPRPAPDPLIPPTSEPTSTPEDKP
ncbi:unnamed protein product [Tuber melanosporum]|uniref:(Perigord truffle) hypothetical protein n=1 Tax=Tuber melanosporum (strain Mel28) TaxID=656061 RepID=D5G6Y7_TUBMM|nr:uncharacterized protein GSTUM_00002387001 [Tuber melanosporum]CAZ80280.1 unnamed protein product [Tuber melanosporum]